MPDHRRVIKLYPPRLTDAELDALRRCAESLATDAPRLAAWLGQIASAEAARRADPSAEAQMPTFDIEHWSLKDIAEGVSEIGSLNLTGNAPNLEKFLRDAWLELSRAAAAAIIVLQENCPHVRT